MIWSKAACVLLPAMTFSCSSGGNFQCNTNTNGKLFSAKAVSTEMSISYPTATRTPCSLDLRGLTGDPGVLRGNKPLVITKTDLKLLPQHGTVKQDGNFISYDPQSAYVGSDNFTVVLTGSAGDVTGVSTLDVSVDIKR